MRKRRSMSPMGAARAAARGLADPAYLGALDKAETWAAELVVVIRRGSDSAIHSSWPCCCPVGAALAAARRAPAPFGLLLSFPPLREVAEGKLGETIAAACGGAPEGWAQIIRAVDKEAT